MREQCWCGYCSQLLKAIPAAGVAEGNGDGCYQDTLHCCSCYSQWCLGNMKDHLGMEMVGEDAGSAAADGVPAAFAVCTEVFHS